MFSTPPRAWLSRAGITVATAVVFAVALAVSLASCGSSSSTYYLALGDSLSLGVQPTKSGVSVPTDTGYVNDLYAHYRARDPGLKLVQMGCPGDDTDSLMTGRGNQAAAQRYHCNVSGGSQLNAAVAFIRAHAGQVKLISIDIGINDVIHCLNGSVFARGTSAAIACVKQGEQSVATNEPKILGALKDAAAPGTLLVGAGVYDPYLASLVLKDGSYGAIATAVANASPALIDTVNTEIAAADTAAGFRTADVGSAFDTADRTEVSSSLGASEPGDVVVLCSYTWACTAAPQGPNIHPNTGGYDVIAKAFERVLPSQL